MSDRPTPDDPQAPSGPQLPRPHVPSPGRA